MVDRIKIFVRDKFPPWLTARTMGILGGFVLVLIGSIIYEPIVSKIKNEMSPNTPLEIFIVSDFSDTSSSKMKDAFLAEFNNENFKIGHVPVETVSLSDKGSTSEAKTISHDISEKSNSLAVVGHFYSETSKVAIPNYLNANIPIPIILTTETNPDLAPSYIKANQQLILKLSPSDVDQAQVAASHAAENGSAFWVVEDSDNSTYANRLAVEFIKNIRKFNDKKILLYSSANDLPSSETLKALNIDSVFYAGNWSNALILIGQIRKLFDVDKIPEIILSDGSVDSEFIKNGGGDVDGVKLTFQMKASAFEQNEYKSYGTDAANVLKKIINSANKKLAGNKFSFWDRWFKYSSHEISKIAFNESLQELMGNETMLFYGEVDDKYFYFNSSGEKMLKMDNDTEKAQFHLWIVNQGKFLDYPVQT